jgi:formylglycine-generating enzyme
MKHPLASSLVMALATASASAAVSIDWVTIGDPGNAVQSAANRTHAFGFGGDGYGAVAGTYRIDRNETTIMDYTEFLNAVAATDTYSLYNASMGTDGNIAGINRSGSSGSYTYSVTGSGARPITYVSWFDAARYTNWLHNGQGAGSTETGAYTLVGGQTSGTAPAKNVGATVWIPTENEWYKAAYYDPTKGASGGYWLHGNRSDSMTTNTIGAAGAANYFDGTDYAVNQSGSYSGSENYLTDAGAYGAGSQSFYGLNDVAGNVYEWNDLDAESSVLRGGSWDVFEDNLRSSDRLGSDPSYESNVVGFRVASVPEPSSILLTMLFTAAIAVRRKR